MDYLKLSKATDLEGRDRKLYRFFEIIPGFLSWGTLLGLLFLSWIKPIWAAYFIIAFNIYWLLLVVYLGIHLVSSYNKLKSNIKIDWRQKCLDLKKEKEDYSHDVLINQGMDWPDLIHLVILPTYNESLDIVRGCVNSIVRNGYPLDNIILVLAIEERAGKHAIEKAEVIHREFGELFKHFIYTVHPDNIEGELKGKGANQYWAAKEVKKKIIDYYNYDYNKILVSVFDIDTEVRPGYFFSLSHKFLSVENPYHASYQPVPFYHNNIWDAPFFARVAASSNTFWQMMQQIREEKLATYSSHSMTWKALVDIGFWSTNMVSEDSRITWHCFCYYNGNYRVEPLHFPVSMDVTMDENFWSTARSLYKQQRRWGWGVENVPYLLFNTVKCWETIDRKKAASKIFVQLYGFHSWATNALIIAVIGWMPMLLGGAAFNAMVLSFNLPIISRVLMTFAMGGLVLSAILSTLLLPKDPNKGLMKNIAMFFQWLILPISIIVFGSLPGLEAQTRLMLGKYMGFWVTPKKR
jgi:cellulose synthase/poly-beta-1,6-N-acetylglucosamine synthase-like glycosyltransferase